MSEGNETTTTECNTTNVADVFFVIDASSSIFADNYVKVLDFVAKVTESFSLGADSVSLALCNVTDKIRYHSLFV